MAPFGTALPLTREFLFLFFVLELLHTALQGDWSHDISVLVTEPSQLSATLGYHFVPTFLYLEISRDDASFYQHSG